VTTPLEPRAACHLSGEARHDWKHSIVEMVRARWPISFRNALAKAKAKSAFG
jgi:alkylated DNA repair dioxygenase AlkB